MTFENIAASELQYVQDRKKGSKWTGSKYESIKDASMTVKGDFGERVAQQCLQFLGIDAEIINGGKGEFDILCESINTRFENKLATEDTNYSFQFNGIKLDVNYDYVFCLGVTPDELLFEIVPKGDFKKFGSFVPMTKDGKDSWKMTVRKNRLQKYSENNLRQRLYELGIIGNRLYSVPTNVPVAL